VDPRPCARWYRITGTPFNLHPAVGAMNDRFLNFSLPVPVEAAESRADDPAVLYDELLAGWRCR